MVFDLILYGAADGDVARGGVVARNIDHANSLP
jgi:hypothetical protein